jgi:hypothetical protein
MILKFNQEKGEPEEMSCKVVDKAVKNKWEDMIHQQLSPYIRCACVIIIVLLVLQLVSALLLMFVVWLLLQSFGRP